MLGNYATPEILKLMQIEMIQQGIIIAATFFIGLIYICFYWVLLSIIFKLFKTIGLWILFKDSNIAPWKSLIPFYRTYLLSGIVLNHELYFLFSYIPFVGFIYSGILHWKLGEKYKKSTLFKIFLVMFPFIFIAGVVTPDKNKKELIEEQK